MLSNINLKISSTMKYTLGFLLVFVLCCFCFIAVIYPLYTDRQKLKTTLAQNNVRLATLQTFAGQNKDYDALVKLQNMKLAAAKKKLPDEISVPELLTEYSKLAAQTGVQLLDLAPGRVNRTSNALELPINITLEGDYFKLITFLQQMESGERFVVINGAGYDAQKSGENLKMKANFVVYALKKVDGAPLAPSVASAKQGAASTGTNNAASTTKAQNKN